MRGFGPGYGQSGATVWACPQHIDAAEQWRSEQYDRKPLQGAAVQVERGSQALSGAAPDPKQGVLI